MLFFNALNILNRSKLSNLNNYYSNFHSQYEGHMLLSLPFYVEAC